MSDYQGEKFRDFLYRKKISAPYAAELLDVSKQTVYQYFKSINLSREVVNRILTTFNASEQDVFGISITPVQEAKPLRLVDPYGFEATGQKFYTLADGSEMMQIPIIPVKAYGSYLRGHADPEWFDAMNFDTMTIPVDKQHRGIYMAFEMDGDSMVNFTTAEYARKSLWPNQRIIGRDLKKEHWKHKLHMHNNEAWIIVHRERGIVVKDIIEHDIDTGRIVCHSWNPDKEQHPDYDIYLDDVEQLMNVVDPFGKMKPY